MASKPKFSDGEKVLCFHHPLIYKAKCIKSMVTTDQQVLYFVHYTGWKKSWDEWVPESYILKYNEENLAKQEEVRKEHLILTLLNPVSIKKPRKSKKRLTGKRKLKSILNSGPNLAEIGLAPLDTNAKPEQHHTNKLDVKIRMPTELKLWLVNDWDIITNQQKLLNLPARVTVEEITNNYLAFKQTSKTNNNFCESTTIEVITAIKEYFNVMLRKQLLYKFEQPLYNEIIKEYPNIPMTKIYGVIHLLRQFVKLGPLLPLTPLNEGTKQILRKHLQDFVMFIENSFVWSLKDYTNASAEYIQRTL